MSFLIAVETRDLTLVLLPLSLLVSNLGRVDSGGQGGRILGISLIFILLLLLVFFGLIGRFEILVRSEHGSPRSLKVILAIYCPLDLELVGADMSRSIFSETIQVSFLYVKT